MHSQPFLGEVVGHHRCQPFKNLQVDIQTAEFVSGVRSQVGWNIKSIKISEKQGASGLSELRLQACWTKCGNMDGNGVSWFLSAAYPYISQGAPNSVWPCSSQRHFALPALGSLHIGKIGANNLTQSGTIQQSTTWKWDFHVTSGSFAQSLLSPPFSMFFISGFM